MVTVELPLVQLAVLKETPKVTSWGVLMNLLKSLYMAESMPIAVSTDCIRGSVAVEVGRVGTLKAF